MPKSAIPTAIKTSIGATSANSAATAAPRAGPRRVVVASPDAPGCSSWGSHSASATVWTAGRSPRPALAQPPVSRLEAPFTVSVLTTNSKHLGPVALGFPTNVIDEFGK